MHGNPDKDIIKFLPSLLAIKDAGKIRQKRSQCIHILTTSKYVFTCTLYPSAKFGIYTVVNLSGTLLEAKILKLKCTKS
jgi:hypothetical protein